MEEKDTKKKFNFKEKLSKKNIAITIVVVAVITFFACCYFAPKYSIANQKLYDTEYKYTEDNYPEDANFITCIETMNMYVQMAQENSTGDGTYVGSDYDDLVMAKMDFISNLAKTELDLSVDKDEVENMKLYIPSDYHKNLDMIMEKMPEKVNKVNKEFNQIKKNYTGAPLDSNQVQAFNDVYNDYYKLIEAINNLAVKSIF